MSPRSRAVASTSRSHRTSTPSASSSYSSLPSYPSPPPSYGWGSPQPPSSPAISTISQPQSYQPLAIPPSPAPAQWPSYPASSSKTVSPYTGLSSITNAPWLEPLKLEDDASGYLPPAQYQSRMGMPPFLFTPNRSIDFAQPLPPLAHLGFATSPPVTSFPITFDCWPFIFKVRNPNGVTISDIATFVRAMVLEPLKEKDAIRLRELNGSPNATKIIDVLGRRTRFGGLMVSPKAGSECVWTVVFIS